MFKWQNYAKGLLVILALFAGLLGFAQPYRLGFWMILVMVVLGWILTAIQNTETQSKKKKR